MMFALSIRQPWVEALILGRKDIEVRAFGDFRYRGPLLLHAGKSPWWSLKRDTERLRALQREDFGFCGAPGRYEALPRGGIVGVAQVVDCLHYDDVGELAADEDRHLMRLRRDAGGGWYWPATAQPFREREYQPLVGIVLESVARLPFSALAGRQNLFNAREDDLDGKTLAALCNWLAGASLLSQDEP